MALAPSVGQQFSVIHSNDPVSIIDYPDSISIMEWSGAQSSAFGVVPITTYLPIGTGTNDDSAAINAAFAALKGQGITLYFPPAVYLVTANAIVTGGVPVSIAAGATFTGTQAATIPNASLSAGATGYRVRAVFTTTAVASYTGTGTNVLTAGSNAALVAQDGVTLAVGDLILLQGGTLGSLAITAADTGPWIVGSLGAAGAKFVLTRPAWWQTGNAIPTGARLEVGPEGTLFGNTTWSAWAAPASVIGTTDPQFYPDRVQTSVTLVASAKAIATIPIRSATQSFVQAQLNAVGGTTTSTIGYGTVVAQTPGYVGTVTVTVNAIASGGTKNGTSDTSVLNVLIVNR